MTLAVGVYSNNKAENAWARPFYAPIGERVDTAHLAGWMATIATGAAQAGAGDNGQTVAMRICGFGDQKKVREDGTLTENPFEGDDNVVFAPVIAVEIDKHPAQARRDLEAVFGKPTIIVESGGIWTDESGYRERKIHAYWRLDKPAVGADLAKLKDVRNRACALVEGDTSGVSIGHPMRLPGSWHTKDEPRLCRIVELNDDRDVPLSVALENVTEALEAKGLTVDDILRMSSRPRDNFRTERPWAVADLQSAVAILPNDFDNWNRWNKIGMTLFDVSHASEDGYEAFQAWSAKATLSAYSPEVTKARWENYCRYPPRYVFGGSLEKELRKFKPDWRPVATMMEEWFEPIDDQGDGILAGIPLGEPAGNVTPLFGDRPDDAAPLWVREMNKRHAIIEHRGDTFPITEEDDGSVSKSSAKSLRSSYAPNPVLQGNQKAPRYDAWEAHPARRFYRGGWAFDPNGVEPGVYNRWRGFPRLRGEDEVVADGAQCQLILRHIEEVVCAGNKEHAAYLLRWLAHLVQHPGDKPGVAVILQGGKGTGKDSLGYYVGRMLPRFYTNTAQQRHMTGNFNAHLATCLLLHVEELGWAGKSKMDDGLLKSLITNPNQIEEQKGVDADPSQKSFLRLLVTSNEGWIVPATQDERRYFVLRVSNERQRQSAYFAELAAEMNGLGPAALRKYLEAIDLTGFDVRTPPATEALAQQKRASLTGFDLYWAEILERGNAYRGPAGEPWESSPVVVEKGDFFRDYERWSKERREPVEGMVQIGIKLSAALGAKHGKLSGQQRMGGDERVTVYRFPALPHVREAFGVTTEPTHAD
ncbi:Primase C terminal 2 (PriCT-2) [Aureimonas phyllosphaerae]|nr:Primase C terminal 2 (PriCT-2) [Aureimonas phyllosphaerae]